MKAIEFLRSEGIISKDEQHLTVTKRNGHKFEMVATLEKFAEIICIGVASDNSEAVTQIDLMKERMDKQDQQIENRETKPIRELNTKGKPGRKPKNKD